MASSKIIRTYAQLIRIPTFEERFEYLKLSAIIGETTFGYERFLNQVFYRSPQWKRVRREVIKRDNGCDMAFPGRDILDRIEVHHINPITIEDVENESDILLDMDNLVCVCPDTHKAIHFGDASLLRRADPIIRRLNDTCPWR